jgi:hypothetical protein
MSDTSGSLIRRAATAACLVCGLAARVGAQSPAPAPAGPDFLPRSEFHLSANALMLPRETEVAFVFHHVSRHISDRPKQFAIAWNVAGARVLRRFTGKGLTVDVRADVGAIVQHSYVDYSWTANTDLLLRRPINSRLGVFVHLSGEVFGVDGSVADRGTQNGGRAEAGLRINGRGGALELFAGGERRLDADPLDRQTHSWGVAGFRLLSR